MKFQIAVSAVKPRGAGRRGSESERGTFSGLTSSYANQGAPQTDSHLPACPEEERRGSLSPQTWLSSLPLPAESPWASREEKTPPPRLGQRSPSPLTCFRGKQVGVHLCRLWSTVLHWESPVSCILVAGEK